ncbi:hypothetical protein [Chryseobacterium gregarium]|uniref:hypothetical protein n=1 Tax=Chryseobacterium gregarium TaxID=456299 RepID=UPI0004279727|nr:hypothetical protein [Chryseobacterium gregarium]
MVFKKISQAVSKEEMEHLLKQNRRILEIMKREYIKQAHELDNQILNIESQIEIWQKSESFNGFDGKIQIRELGLSGHCYDVNLQDVPFGKIKKLFLEHYKDQKQIKEKELEQLLIDSN